MAGITTPDSAEPQRVRCVKATSAQFAALMAQLIADPPGPGPDENTLYFVNENGSFAPEATAEGGLIYLGPKLLTPPAPDVFTPGGDENPPTPGRNGLVPAPAYAQRNQFLRGDGSWQTPPGPSVMTGATAQAAGSQGLVPQPAAGNHEKYLRGDGTWAWPAPMYGTCTSGAGTVNKTVTDLTGPFQLVNGAVIFVRFSNSNTASSPTLNVMGTGAIPIKRYGSTSPGTASYHSWNAGSVQCLVYDGPNNRWMLLGWLNTLYSDATQSTHGLMSTADKAKVDHLPASVVQPVLHVANSSWVGEVIPYYQDESDYSASSTGMYLNAYQADDWIELTAHLTCGNTDTNNGRTVLLAIEKYDNNNNEATTLASAAVTLEAAVQGKTVIEHICVTALYKVLDSDITHSHRFRIHMIETDNHSVRLYSGVPCGNDYVHKASTYTLKAWREVSI